MKFAATFNRAGSSKLAGVRMKVRQAYEGRVIEARSSELKEGGWDCEFSIEEHETTGVTRKDSQVCPKRVEPLVYYQTIGVYFHVCRNTAHSRLEPAGPGF
jgi:hypothetical protein